MSLGAVSMLTLLLPDECGSGASAGDDCNESGWLGEAGSRGLALIGWLDGAAIVLMGDSGRCVVEAAKAAAEPLVPGRIRGGLELVDRAEAEAEVARTCFEGGRSGVPLA